MTRRRPPFSETTQRVVSVFLALAVWGAACGGPPAPASPPPAPISPGPPTPAAVTEAPAPAPPPSATPLQTRPALTVCLSAEPETLFPYARLETDGALSRAHLLALLADDPLDRLAAGPQPGLLERLPGPAAGDVRVEAVRVQAGDRVVDALGRVVTLTAGVTLNLLDGAQVTYDGVGPLRAFQRTVRFTLRPGLRWSDGAPLTAADSLFSYQLASDPAAYVPERDRLARTAAYRAVDERSLEWVGWPGDLDPDYLSHFWPPLPRHLWQGRTAADLAADPAAGRAWLSSGPFVIAGWEPGDRVDLERNPHYWRAAEGLPRLERVVVRFLPASDLGRALESRECEVVPRQPDWDALAEAPAYARWAPAAAQVSLFFGLAPADSGPERPGLFADRRAREAVAHCLDRATLTPPPSALERQAAGALYPGSLPEPGFDPARGRALLAETGWQDSDADGALDQSGQPVRVRLVVGPGGATELLAVAEAIQAQLRTNCGLMVEVQALTDGEWSADWPDGPVFGRRFDLALLAWRTDRAPCAFFLSEQVADAANPAGVNLAGYREPAFDAACRRALTALDGAEAQAGAAQAQARLAQDLPLWPVFYEVRSAAARPEVAGFAVDPLAASELWNVETLTVWP